MQRVSGCVRYDSEVADDEMRLTEAIDDYRAVTIDFFEPVDPTIEIDKMTMKSSFCEVDQQTRDRTMTELRECQCPVCQASVRVICRWRFLR